jgi:hypothetical protein
MAILTVHATTKLNSVKLRCISQLDDVRRPGYPNSRFLYPLSVLRFVLHSSQMALKSLAEELPVVFLAKLVPLFLPLY